MQRGHKQPRPLCWFQRWTDDLPWQSSFHLSLSRRIRLQTGLLCQQKNYFLARTEAWASALGCDALSVANQHVEEDPHLNTMCSCLQLLAVQLCVEVEPSPERHPERQDEASSTRDELAEFCRAGLEKSLVATGEESGECVTWQCV